MENNEPMDVDVEPEPSHTANLNRIEEVRHGLVNNSAELFYDLNLPDDDAVNTTAKNFLEFFRLCVSNTPTVFYYKIDPNIENTNSQEMYSEIELRVFSKWIYRTCSTFLMTPRFSSLHDTMTDLIKSLLITLKHNHGVILTEALGTFVRMTAKICTQMTDGELTFKVVFQNDKPRRHVQVRTPLATIKYSMIQNVLELVSPHMDIIKQDSGLLESYLYTLLFLLQKKRVPAANKLKIVVDINLSFDFHFSQCRILWCHVIRQVIEICFENEGVENLFKTFLKEIKKRCFHIKDSNISPFLIDLESLLFNFIVGPIFKSSENEILKSYMVDFYLNVKESMEKNGLETYNIAQIENTNKFATEIYETAPLALPIFVDVVYKEIFRVYDISPTEVLDYSRTGDRTPIWTLINEKWVESITKAEEAKLAGQPEEIRSKFLDLCKKSRGYISLVGSVANKGTLFETYKRGPERRYIPLGVIDNDFRNRLKRILELQEFVYQFIETDFANYLRWLFVFIKMFGPIPRTEDQTQDHIPPDICTQLIRLITFPFFPKVFVEMNPEELQEHRRHFGTDLMEETLKILGSDMFLRNVGDKPTITKILETAIASNQPECIRGILYLIANMKHICRFLDREVLIQYMQQRMSSEIWMANENIGILLAQAIGRFACIYTKVEATAINGTCEVCRDGNSYYEPKNSKIKKLKEFATILMDNGSHAIQMTVLDSLVHLRCHGLIPTPQIVSNYLTILQKPLQFSGLVKILQVSSVFLTVYFPTREDTESFKKLFRMIFAYIRSFLKSFDDKLMYDVLMDLIDSFSLLAKNKNNTLAVEICKLTTLILTLRWSNCIGNKCKLLFRTMAESRSLKTSEYMGQIREEIGGDFVDMCLKEIFGKVLYTKDAEQVMCDKCEVVLRVLENAMEFNRDDFIAVYFPLLLSYLVPMGSADKRARLMIRSLAHFSLIPVKELLELHFPCYFPAIGMRVPNLSALDQISSYLKTQGILVQLLTALIIQALVNQILSYLSIHQDKVKLLLSTIILWHNGQGQGIVVKHLDEWELRNFLADRLMGILAYLDSKLSSGFENVEMKKIIFNSFVETISFLGQKITTAKIRLAKLLTSCSRKPYLQQLALSGWKAFTLNLEDSAIPSMMNQILSSILYLESIPGMPPNTILEEVANYIINDKMGCTRKDRNTVYYIEDRITNRQTVSLIRNSKPTGVKFFEFLIENLSNCDTYTRHHALLAMSRIVKYEDTSVELKELLEDSQFVHPLVCRLILGLLDCVQSQDKDISRVSTAIFGELGAIDYYRMKLKSMNRQSRRDATAIFPTGMQFAHQYFEMLRKQYQGNELTLPSDIDIEHVCAYTVQEILKIYNIQHATKASNHIWTNLSTEARNLFTPLLLSKYGYKENDVKANETYPSPLYGSARGKTHQDWITNFIIQMQSFITSEPAKQIFRVTLPLMMRSPAVAIYMLPYVGLFAALDGNQEQRLVIYSELKVICRRWYLGNEMISTSPLRDDTPFHQDSIFDEPTVVNDIGVADQLLVTNSVFSIIDLVSYVWRYGKSNFSALKTISEKGHSGFYFANNPEIVNGTAITHEKINNCISIVPDPLCMARAAFQTQSYQRALLNLEQFLFVFPERTQRYLPFLQRIFIALEDKDSVVGASEIRRCKPNIYEETLELLATAKKEDAASKFQVMMQKGISDGVLVQGYLSIERPEMALTIMNGLADHEMGTGSSYLDECRLEACWKLQKWDELSTNLKAVRTDFSSRGTLMHAAILSKFQRKQYGEVVRIITTAREKCQQSLTTSEIHIDSYHRKYAEITRLHILSEIEQAVQLMEAGKAKMSVSEILEYRVKFGSVLKNWKSRLGLVQKSLNIIEPIINTRKALLHIMMKNTKRTGIDKLCTASIRDCWLTVAKLEARAKNYGRANASIQEARQLRSPEVFIQDAKLLALRGDMDRGIRVIQECMKQYFPRVKIQEWEESAEAEPVTEEQKLCAKALLLLSKFNDEKCKVDMDINIQNYLQVTKVCKKSEKNFFHLASYYDSIWNDQQVKKKQHDMQLAVVKYYCKSLEYGSKHVYQSLPRLLFIWFSFSTAKPIISQGEQVEAFQKTLKSYNDTLKEMSGAILHLFRTVPAYIFLTAYSQLISRICHPNETIWNILKTIIVGIVLNHPHQAIWMLMAVSKSTYPMRKTRCSEILRMVEQKSAELKPLINDYNTLADQLIKLATHESNGARLTTIQQIAPNLIELFSRPNFSSIIIPFQQFLSVTISRVGSHHLTHNPFQQSPVYIHGIERNVEIMPSQICPKKITLRGTNGGLYGVLCKPSDDLRKDSKVMEMNHIVNWYLGRDPESRQRNLHVRTYAVVPLNEETGIMEYVPNLQGLRPLIYKLYREKGISLGSREVKLLYHGGSGVHTPTNEKVEEYKKLVNRHPPVLREWFQTYFSDPQEWYTARMTFTRTAAVMSMVGYLIGLGDRHGENILLDSISGDVVHVDFNCLFNKGETFDIPEMVPFRLTHNMVNAMGPLGFEGPFRRSCEITVEVLRQNSNVFMSVLRPFVFDPLVEWSKVRHAAYQQPTSRNAKPDSITGEINNATAMESIRNIQLRLQGVSRNMTKELNVALSVEAQVNYLIKEATNPVNLCQMYVGWGSYY